MTSQTDDAVEELATDVEAWVRFSEASIRAAYRFLNPTETTHPLGYTAWLLATYINPEEPTLTEDRAAWQLDHGKPIKSAGSSRTSAGDLRPRQADNDAQIEAARIAAIDWEAVNQAIQAMHKQFPRNG